MDEPPISSKLEHGLLNIHTARTGILNLAIAAANWNTGARALRIVIARLIGNQTQHSIGGWPRHQTPEKKEEKNQPLTGI